MPKKTVEQGTANLLAKYSCPYCLKTFDAFEAIKSHIVADHKAESLPEPEGTIHLMVNGQEYKFQVEPDWTLFYLIHDQLGFTGTKLMCDRGACGSCTVIMNGRPILSCMTLAIECNGKQIETVEGIAASNHPLVEEYVKHHCMQCGYCTPGFVMAAHGLLNENPLPTLEEIKEGLSGNLCRCGCYPAIARAVWHAAQKMNERSRKG
jgi:aerobic-type carbon monoxide dehydrogenase small subunit (CoxS/CutS family)